MILDHYTIHTADLERSRRFYQDILGLTAGYRPPFEGPPGAWLYGPNERPVVHLYAGRQSVATDVGAMDHIKRTVERTASWPPPAEVSKEAALRELLQCEDVQVAQLVGTALDGKAKI